MKIKDKILNIRKENNLTQEEFADILCVTRQTVSNWETKGIYPDIETLIIISDKFKISLDDLLKEDKEMVKDIDKEIKKSLKRKHIILGLIMVLIIGVIFGSIILIKNKIELLNDYNETITEFKKLNLYERERINIKTKKEQTNQNVEGLSIYIPENLKLTEKGSSAYHFEDENNHSIWFWIYDHSVGTSLYRQEFYKNNLKTFTDLLFYYENHIDDTYSFFSSSKKIKLHLHCAEFLKTNLFWDKDYSNLVVGDLKGYYKENEREKTIGLNANHKYYQIMFKNYSKEEVINILETIYFS
ncbi:MAG: helix-turn-helix domain-containing protein [Ruminococcus sp.]|nr:helix-turn-helix domain-containing protein [Ruminococcus sp.]